MISQFEVGSYASNLSGDIEHEFIIEIITLAIVGIGVPIILATPLFIFVPETHSFLHSVSCIALDIYESLYGLYILIYNALLYPLCMIIPLLGYIYTEATSKAPICHDGKDFGSTACKDNKQDCDGEKAEADSGLGKSLEVDPDSDEPNSTIEDIASDSEDGSGFEIAAKNEDTTPDELLSKDSFGKSDHPDLDPISDSVELVPTASELETYQEGYSGSDFEAHDDSSIPSCLKDIDSGLVDSIVSLSCQGSDAIYQLAILNDDEQSQLNNDTTENSLQESQFWDNTQEQVGKQKVFNHDTKGEGIPIEQMGALPKLDFSENEHKKDDFDFVIDAKGGILTLPFSLGKVTFIFPRKAVLVSTRMRIAAGKEKPDDEGMSSRIIPSLHIFEFSKKSSQKFIQPVKFRIPIMIETKLLVECDINEMELCIAQSSNDLNWETAVETKVKKSGDGISVKIASFAGLRIVAKQKYMELFYSVYLKRPSGIADPKKHFVIAQIHSNGSFICGEASRAFESGVNDVIMGKQNILVRTPCNLRGRISVTSMQTSPEVCLLKIDSNRINILREMNFVIDKFEPRAIERNETFDMEFILQCDGLPPLKITQGFYWTVPIPTLIRNDSVVSIYSVKNLTMDVGERATGIENNVSYQRSESSFELRDYVFYGDLHSSSAPLLHHDPSDESDYDVSEENFSGETADKYIQSNINIQHLDHLHINVRSPLHMTTPVHQSTPKDRSSENMQTSRIARVSTSSAEPNSPPNFYL